MNKDDIKQVLHDLDHQKMEAIGVEELANEAKPMISALGLTLSFSNLSVVQDVAAFIVVTRIIQEKMTCPDCIDLVNRIAEELYKNYTSFVEKNQ